MSTGLSDQGKKRLHEVAQRHVGDEQVPGLVALVARGDQVHAEALGSLAIGGPAVQRDSLFRIASVTKPVTGAATLALAGRGCSTWTSRWPGCCPSWPAPGCCAGWTARWTTPCRPAARSPCATCSRSRSASA